MKIWEEEIGFEKGEGLLKRRENLENGGGVSSDLKLREGLKLLK